MSQKHPIVAVTGSSGAGTSTVKRAFEHIFIREKITPVIIEGDSFHRCDRAEMKISVETTEGEKVDVTFRGTVDGDKVFVTFEFGGPVEILLPSFAASRLRVRQNAAFVLPRDLACVRRCEIGRKRFGVLLRRTVLTRRR